MTAQQEIKKVPALRFPEFDGEWEYKKLENLVERIGDGIHSTPNYSDSGKYYFINGNNLSDGKIFISENTKKVNEEEYLKHKRDLGLNTILLSINGTIGNVAYYKNEKIVLGKSACYINISKNVSKEFILHVLSTFKTLKFYYSELTGTTIKNLSLATVRNTPIPNLVLPEQQKIADFLTAVDERIQQLTRKKELLEQYKKGVMQQLFSQQIRFKDDNGNDYPDWEEKKLGEVAFFSKGKGISKDDIDDYGELECIRYGELYTEYGEVIKDVKSKTALDPKGLVLSEYNDVIIPASGETAIDIATAACVQKDNVALGGDLNIIKTDIEGVFLSYYLNNKRRFDIARLSQGSSVMHLYSSQLKTLCLNIPIKPEQQKIANYLSSIDDKIALVNNELDQSKEFKKGLLQQMFV